MLATDTITPEIEMKALEYINTGYQKILTFECASGGFYWWEGDDPGNAILSAVAIQMLTDTKTVYDTVDEAVIQRAADYLVSVQKTDGSWSEETHLHAGNENLGAGSLRATCYIAWSLASGGFEDLSATTKAMDYIKSKLPSETDDYTKAMCANALVSGGAGNTLVSSVLSDFHGKAVVDGELVYWASTSSTLVNSGGSGADVELTSLVAIAMASSGSFPQDVQGAVNWLVQSKDPQGNWGYNTQATVLALKTFLKALNSNTGPTNADVTVTFNGQEIATKHFDDFNKDVLWQVELTQGFAPDQNVVELEYAGLGALSYQVVSTHYLPWENVDAPEGPLSIDVTYDTNSLNVDDTVTATVTIANSDPSELGMVLVTVGIPPGFILVASDLATLKASGAISEYETTGKNLILYFNTIPAGTPTQVSYDLVAEFPITAQTGGAEAKFYYNAEVSANDESQEIEVQP